MKAVLMSIQPKWCELIASGKKTVEVRKTKPKLETPFKCYIYCTADRRKHICDTFVPQTPLFVKNGVAKSSIGREDGLPWKLGNGKVIGEFVCDTIHEFTKAFFDEQEPQDTEEIGFWLDQFNLSYNDLRSYVGAKDFYGWHISDLVIYDKPKELSQVLNRKQAEKCVNHCEHNGMCQYCEEIRPPQSWCYVEEVEQCRMN